MLNSGPAGKRVFGCSDREHGIRAAPGAKAVGAARMLGDRQECPYWPLTISVGEMKANSLELGAGEWLVAVKL